MPKIILAVIIINLMGTSIDSLAQGQGALWNTDTLRQLQNVGDTYAAEGNIFQDVFRGFARIVGAAFLTGKFLTETLVNLTTFNFSVLNASEIGSNIRALLNMIWWPYVLLAIATRFGGR